MRIIEEHYSDCGSRHILRDNDLGSFGQMWELDIPWFEQPNQGRKGFSGVMVHEIISNHGEKQRIFIKRQRNHNTRTLKHPLAGVPTFYREFQNINRLRKLKVPTIDVLYFGLATHEGEQCAILVSRALDEYFDLDDWLAGFGSGDRQPVLRMIDALVPVLKAIHQLGYRHGCLYGKHIFVKHDASRGCAGFEFRLLDFEKAHRPLLQRTAILKDLSQLIRHSTNFQPAEITHLIDRYFDYPGAAPMKSALQRLVAGKPGELITGT